jgi:hypothetical protein
MSKEKFAEMMRDDGSGGPAPTDKGMARFGNEVWAEIKRQADHGATELMSAAYTGNAFTPYGWGKVDPGQEVQAPATPEVQQPEQEIERGGRD